MNIWQQAQQLRYLMQSAEWSASVPVFGSAVVSAGAREIPQSQGQRLPMVWIQPGSATSDAEEPSLITAQWTLWIIASVASDAMGEASLLGANRVGSGSRGRGLLELEEQLTTTIAAGLDDIGMRHYVRARSAPAALVDEALGYVVLRSYTVETLATTARYYHPATRLAATGAALTWTLPPDRFDRYRVVLRRASGSTPPATVSSGTGVTLASDLPTSHTDSPGIGTWSYSLFSQYDETNDTPAAADQTSAADTVTTTV